MIGPGMDADEASDDELIAAYAEVGLSEEDARVYIAQLRLHDPRYPD